MFANLTHRNSLPLVPLSICIIGFFFHQFVYCPMSDEQLPPKLVFFFYACGCAARSYMPSLYMDLLPLLLVGLHTVIYDSYYAIPTLVDSTPSP
jgi:hypothetical protein